MTSFGKFAATIAFATTAILGATAPASADHSTRDLCAGLVEADGCWYCSYQAGVTSEPPTNCHYGYFGYAWAECRVYAAEVCVVGKIV